MRRRQDRVEPAPASEGGVLAGYISEEQWAKQRRVSRRVVQRERQLRTGPAFTKIGKRVFYRIEAVREWLLAHEQQPLRRRR